jgi:hypothetical protein
MDVYCHSSRCWPGGGFFVARGAFSQSTGPRRAISLPDDNARLSFSVAILTGNTLYLSGRIAERTIFR